MKNLKTEIFAGLTTFLTMSYILVVNPTILSSAGTGMSFGGVLTATVITAALSSLAMGLYAKLPFALAPGMGLNAFFTYGMVLGLGLSWPVALGLVFWSGVVFLLISATPLRENLARALPQTLKLGAGAGIGAFLVFIGRKSAGLVVAHPATFVSFGPLTWDGALTLLSVCVALTLARRGSSFAFLLPMLATTLVLLLLGRVDTPAQWLSWPNFESHFFKLDLTGALHLSLLPVLLSLVLTDLFDSVSTFVGVAEAAELKDGRGEPKNLRQGLIVDALATTASGLFGTSAATTYIESAAGVKAGGRSGAVAITVGLCFLPCLFLAPVLSLVPAAATAGVLVAVGLLMLEKVKDLKDAAFEDRMTALITTVAIPLTFSITKGLMLGLFAQSALYLLAGKGRQLSPPMIVLGVVAAGYLVWG